MIETAQQDTQDLWAQYQATKALVNAQGTLIATFQAALATLQAGGSSDFSSIANSGQEGSESWSQVTLLQKLNDAITRYTSLQELEERQRLLAIKSSAGFVETRIPANGIACPRRDGW